jgi:predicted O-methyltransferase YrrM
MSKLSTALWLSKRPAFYPHLFALTSQRLRGTRDDDQSDAASQWATERAVSIQQGFDDLGLAMPTDRSVPAELLDEAAKRATKSTVEMGGAAALDLLYRAILSIGATRVVETGVAYGWSSLAALAALRETGGALTSVDMPYPKANNEPFVGIVVPDELRAHWTLIRRPDRGGLARAIASFNGTIDLCHYDSDKSYSGRMYGYGLLWRALRDGGLLISDDIVDNFGFRDFCQREGASPTVIQSADRLVGLAVKR